MVPRIRIAIDGPAGAGKSTVARLVARELGYLYIDTGAMYRMVTLQALRSGIDLNDAEALTMVAENSAIRLTADPENLSRAYLAGEDVTVAIRSPEVSRAVSLVAGVPGVRRQMVELQRATAVNGGVVMEGRDIGTTVLPGAEVKFFMTATPGERARRRGLELQAGGYQVNLDELEEEIMERDLLDSTRELAPLAPAPDAEIIDCSTMAVEQVVKMIVARVTGRTA
jgi:cytidylate kinase